MGGGATGFSESARQAQEYLDTTLSHVGTEDFDDALAFAVASESVYMLQMDELKHRVLETPERVATLVSLLSNDDVDVRRMSMAALSNLYNDRTWVVADTVRAGSCSACVRVCLAR